MDDKEKLEPTHVYVDHDMCQACGFEVKGQGESVLEAMREANGKMDKHQKYCRGHR